MMRACLPAALLLLAASDANAQRKSEPLVERVARGIQLGITYLRQEERGEGSFEKGPIAALRSGGMTCLATLAMLNAGVPPNDPLVVRCLQTIRKMEMREVYTVALTIMVYVEAGYNEDRERIQRGVDWLLDARMLQGDKLRGWSYGKGGITPDNSNAQYALLGLYAGHSVGAKVDRAIWQSIQDYYTRTQNKVSFGWSYHPESGNQTLTMSTAGICGMLIAGLELNPGREAFAANGTVSNCGQYAENAPLARAMGWLSSDQGFRLQYKGATFYNLYGIERTGRLTGQRFIGQHDWYREGCTYLVGDPASNENLKGRQKEDGSWSETGNHDSDPIVSTSFALLFLSKGRVPVLISKLVHGPGEDWNNDRNDVRRLTEHASKELFKKLPLAWQIFDVRRLEVRNNAQVVELVRDLLQSPIAYINGHLAPQFSELEISMLKQFIEQGGFLMAEACCSRPEFDSGFRELMKEMFPDNPLKPLPPEHPAWRAHFAISPGSYPLEGIEHGCKTVVIYSPKDLSCYWEGNHFKEGQGQLAFRVGTNIVAYATGLEPPKPRLSLADAVADDPEGKQVPRGYLKVAQLRHDGDWQPAPNAMRNLLSHLRGRARLDVSLHAKAMMPGDVDLADFRFLYLHGRGSFSFSPAAVKNLRTHLETGGLLLADACCGKKPFDESFRKMIQEVFPDKKLEPIDLKDDLYSAELNGGLIANTKRRTESPGPYQSLPPALEGIRLGNRWVVVYSRLDLGCALEKHQSSDCLGYDHESALRLAGAAVLYFLKR